MATTTKKSCKCATPDPDTMGYCWLCDGPVKGWKGKRADAGSSAPGVIPPGLKQPSARILEKWAEAGVAEATDGCKVESDGICPHGNPSWLLQMGLI